MYIVRRKPGEGCKGSGACDAGMGMLSLELQELLVMEAVSI